MSLIDNLQQILECKTKIKEALIEKGVSADDMENLAFNKYAETIKKLQLNTTPPDDGSSDPTPDPTPSADYIYSNGYIEGGTNDIITYIPYEIKTDDDGGHFVEENDALAIELICPVEIRGVSGKYMNIVFTVDIPENYDIVGFYLKGISGEYETYELGFKENPRNKTIERNGVTYKSFVRVTAGGTDYSAPADISSGILYYKITIKKQSI